MPNYIQLLVENQNSGNANFIISYYQDDSSFTNRKQLSQNSTNMTIMWLNKEQIKNTFYLSIECGTSKCQYNFSIIPEDNIKLYLGQIYKYYITEQNKEMKFNIEGSLNSIYDIITIYAKGYRDISTKLDVKKYKKHSKYNAYIINDIGALNIKYNFIVNGKVGDLITVGAFFSYGGGSSVLSVLNEGYEYSGFLKKDILEKNCFPYNLLYQYSLKAIYNDFNNQAFSMTYDYFGMCITMFEEVDEIFYSFYTYKNEYEEDANLIPLFPGHYDYYDKNISVIPIIPDDFNSLTYKIYTYQEKTKAYIINCETYPFCNLDLNNKNNIKELEKLYDTYFITFNENELESNWSPINKKQHVIVFECDNSNSVDKCEMNLEIYTDKTQLNLIYDAISNYYFIQKGNINNFILSIYSSKNIIVEKITGDISIQKIKLNNDIYNYNNIYLYECDENERYIAFQIKAEKNSIYNIKTYDGFNLKLRGNYILNLNDNNTKRMSLQNYYQNNHEVELPNYFSIYPIGCNINISLEFYDNQKTEILPLQLNHGFYQNISYISYNYYLSRYILIQKLDKKDSCMIYLSYFLLEVNSNNNHFLDSVLILS